MIERLDDSRKLAFRRLQEAINVVTASECADVPGGGGVEEGMAIKRKCA